MADSTLTALTAAAALDGTELYYTVQGGADRKATGAQIKTLVLAGATTQLGAADAAAPVAQTLKVQSVVGGTANTAGADFTISGSQGTGSGAGGPIKFNLAPTGGAGSAQNALATALSIVNVPGTGNFAADYRLQFGTDVSLAYSSAYGALAVTNIAGTSGGNLIAGGLQSTGGVTGVYVVSAGAELGGSTWRGASQSITLLNNSGIGWSSTGAFTGTPDLYIIRGAAASLQLGDVDAAAPVAQTLQVQSVVAGTANTAGTDLTISGSKGTGTGAPGLIKFKTAPAGGTGSSQNALATAMTVGSVSAGHESTVTFASRIGVDGAAPSSAGISIACFGTISAGNGYAAVGSTSILGQTSAFLYSPGYITLHAGNATPIILLGDDDAAAPVAQTLQVQSVVAGTTDTAGVAWTRVASKGTSTGAGGNIIEKTGFSAKSTGSTQHTTVDRKVIVAKGKVLTDATPVSLFEIALPTLTMCGGQIEATVVCTDGTDMQSFTQTISYSAVNKGGVYTKSITASTGDKSVSGGSTLVNTWTLLDGTNKVTVQLSSDTSLSPSTNAFMVYYSVKNNSEQATTIL